MNRSLPSHAFKFTSYNSASSGSVVNGVPRSFNGLGQLRNEFQAHNGSVNTGSTLRVGSSDSEMAGSANHSRLVSMSHPFTTSPSVPPARSSATMTTAGWTTTSAV